MKTDKPSFPPSSPEWMAIREAARFWSGYKSLHRDQFPLAGKPANPQHQLKENHHATDNVPE